jgi:predicted HTH domain antitoxin
MYKDPPKKPSSMTESHTTPPNSSETASNKSRPRTADTTEELAALHLYKNGTISLGKAGEILGLLKQEMLHLLSIRGIPINYTTDDLKLDLETLDQVLG